MKKFFLTIKKFLGLPDSNTKLEKAKVFLMGVIQLSIFGAIISAVIRQRWMVLFVSFVAIGTIWITRVVARRSDFSMPVSFEFLLTFFLYTSLILGDVQGFYARFWWWDKALHLVPAWRLDL